MPTNGGKGDIPVGTKGKTYLQPGHGEKNGIMLITGNPDVPNEVPSRLWQGCTWEQGQARLAPGGEAGR